MTAPSASSIAFTRESCSSKPVLNFVHSPYKTPNAGLDAEENAQEYPTPESV
jgi:hypothetical protein